jgi:PAS domain S-box-containing protein
VDITERKQAEAAQVRLAAIVNSSDDAIISKTLDGFITSWNPGAQKIFGYNADEVIGKPMLILFPPDRLAEEKEILARIARGESVDHYETIRIRKDGKAINLSVTISPIVDTGGRVIGASKIARDITARKHVEVKLRESEERFTNVFHNSPVAMGLSRLSDGKIVEVNQAWMDFTGYSLAEVVGRTPSELGIVERDTSERNRELLRSKGGIPTGEFTLRTRAGEQRIVLATGKVIPIAGEPHILGSMLDITERKRAESALIASEERYRTTLDNMMEGCQLIGFGWEYLYVNQAALIHARRTETGLLGEKLTQVWPGIETTEVFALLERCMRERVALHDEIEFVFPDGDKGWFDLRVQPVPEGIFLLSVDISERHRAEKLFRESQAMYHSLVEQMPAGIFRKDLVGRFVFVSEAFCKLKAMRPEQLLGRTALNLDLEDTVLAANGANHHEQIVQNGSVIEVEEKHVHPDGREFYFHVVKTPVFDSFGKIIGSQGILFDVTARKLAEQEVLRLNTELEQRVVQRTAQLEAANKELEAFSYSVSHDLRAPLRAVNGFAGIVLEDFGPQLPDQGRKYLERIRNGGQRMGVLIDDLLEFSRLSRQPLEKQEVDMSTLVQNALEELKSQRAGRDIELRLGKLPPCYGDAALLKQVWVNLLSNAIKYSRGRQPAVIEIGCTNGAGSNSYFVRDNGTGFEMQYVHKLFGVFQRLHCSDDFEGTGVGLAIVQRVVHRHGGRAWAEGKEDQGATFYFNLGERAKL